MTLTYKCIGATTVSVEKEMSSLVYRKYCETQRMNILRGTPDVYHTASILSHATEKHSLVFAPYFQCSMLNHKLRLSPRSQIANEVSNDTWCILHTCHVLNTPLSI